MHADKTYLKGHHFSAGLQFPSNRRDFRLQTSDVLIPQAKQFQENVRKMLHGGFGLRAVPTSTIVPIDGRAVVELLSDLRSPSSGASTFRHARASQYPFHPRPAFPSTSEQSPQQAFVAYGILAHPCYDIERDETRQAPHPYDDHEQSALVPGDHVRLPSPHGVRRRLHPSPTDVLPADGHPRRCHYNRCKAELLRQQQQRQQVPRERKQAAESVRVDRAKPGSRGKEDSTAREGGLVEAFRDPRARASA